IERLAAEAPSTDRWFQLYIWRDRGRSRDLIARLAESGYRVLVLTVDVPVAGARHRDVYNGLTIPPSLTARTILGMLGKPRWLFDAATTEPLAFESLGAAEDVMGLINTVFDPSVTVADIEWLRAQWDGPIVVKGIQRVDDAVEVVSAGADAVAVSNHGGRQLDRAATPLELLPSVVDSVGASAEGYVDGGVRSGADVAAAVAFGANAAFVGRPYLYALMAGGEAGVNHLTQLLRDDYIRTLKLLGLTETAGLDRDLVTLAREPQALGTTSWSSGPSQLARTRPGPFFVCVVGRCEDLLPNFCPGGWRRRRQCRENKANGCRADPAASSGCQRAQEVLRRSRERHAPSVCAAHTR